MAGKELREQYEKNVNQADVWYTTIVIEFVVFMDEVRKNGGKCQKMLREKRRSMHKYWCVCVSLICILCMYVCVYRHILFSIFDVL